MLVSPAVRRHGWALAAALVVGVVAGTVAAGLPAGWVLFAALAALGVGSELRVRTLARHLRTEVRRLSGPDLRVATALMHHPWSLPGTGRPATLVLQGGVARLELPDGRPGGFVAQVGDVHLAPWRLRTGPVLELGTPAGTLFLAGVAHPDLAFWALPCVPILHRAVGHALGGQRRWVIGTPDSAPANPGGGTPRDPRLAP